MSTILLLNCSGRTTRSITRRLSQRFCERWTETNGDGQFVIRDLGLTPPPFVNENWIAGAFAEPAERDTAMLDALRLSEELVDELVAADLVVIATPIYNFGLPANLKAYFDQVVRIGRTFAFSPENPEPYQPLLANKPVLVITAAGDGSMNPGGAFYHLNFLEPHIATILGFMGLTDLTFIRAAYDEYQDERLARSLASAEASVDEYVERLSEKTLTAC